MEVCEKNDGFLSEWVELYWCPGVTFKAMPWLISGQDVDTVIWKSGVPDPARPGMISGEKENEWTVYTGFAMVDGDAVWTPGAPHPSISGVIAGTDICTWAPDENHL